LRASGLPAPFHLAASFATYPHLTLREKLSIANALMLGVPSSVILSEGAERRSRTTDSAETFETWLTLRKQGAGERRAFWDPFFIPALNAPFDRVTAEDALFVLRTAFLSDAGAARFGFSTVPLAHLAAAAAQKLDAVHTSMGVLSLEAADGGKVTLRPSTPALRASAQGDTRSAYDGVVLAVPPRALANILGDPQAYGVENLDAYEAYPIIDVHLWHDAGSIGLDFAAALDSPLQWIFEKAPGYLACSFSAADDNLRRPTAELEGLAWGEVQAFLPALADAKLVRSAVTRNPEATWLPRAGARRTSQRTSHPAIAVAGAWTDTGWPDTMESAVRSGTLAATHLLRASREGTRHKNAMSPA
jgi:hypothetical protein